MQRLLGQKCGTCFQRCVGTDAFNSLHITAFETDQRHGTDYHRRILEYLKMAEVKDWVVDGAMTDPKQDRSLRPAQAPDGCVRVVERKDGGGVIRGAKMHQTGTLNSHQILVMPTIAIKEEERDFAVCCALPADAPGITYIYGRQSCDTRLLEDPAGTGLDIGSAYGGQECMVVFDDVFVPREARSLDHFVQSVAAEARQARVDTVIGLGGGSSIDTAKMTAALVANEREVAEYLGGTPLEAAVLPILAVPTTAGTGSEATHIAILSDEAAQVKKGLVSVRIMPRYAFLDPELTRGLPPAIPAATGMDALCHTAALPRTQLGYFPRLFFGLIRIEKNLDSFLGFHDAKPFFPAVQGQSG